MEIKGLGNSFNTSSSNEFFKKNPAEKKMSEKQEQGIVLFRESFLEMLKRQEKENSKETAK